MKRPLHALQWEQRYTALPEPFYQRVAPTPMPDPRLVAFNPDVAELLELDPEDAGSPEFVAALNGERPLPGTDPLAQAYAGHQFGVWVPQLGDGRAILLGEVVTSHHTRWEVQLKGSGLTRFSRMGDGRAVLRSTIREYLASEAMHALGIPTTRALAILGSELPVFRERVEGAALLIRVAPSHVRFGTFEYFAARGETDHVALLLDHVITHHFPELLSLPMPERRAAWFREVVDRTARLMADWIALGFAHGVMNTDNMSILGLTLDYGPYGFLDEYDHGFICNHTDQGGRYAFDQQPRVGLWNLTRLAEALHPLLDETTLRAVLESYPDTFADAIDARMRGKLGLRTAHDDDPALIGRLLALLQANRADYTRFFRALAGWSPAAPEASVALRAELSDRAALDAWLTDYARRLELEGSIDGARQEAMRRVNPKYVLRNWIAQEAIANAETRNYDRIAEVHRVLRTPYDDQPGAERYAEGPPEWAREIVVSCSS